MIGDLQKGSAHDSNRVAKASSPAICWHLERDSCISINLITFKHSQLSQDLASASKTSLYYEILHFLLNILSLLSFSFLDVLFVAPCA